LNVFVSPTSSFGVTPTLSVNVDLNALLFGEAHVGFTAATGGFNAEHRITDWTAPLFHKSSCRRRRLVVLPFQTTAALHLYPTICCV
jgi:hypothetical protein